ncbi:MAG: hypothetical protein ACI87M_000739, partial [Yoonia sp.]
LLRVLDLQIDTDKRALLLFKRKWGNEKLKSHFRLVFVLL